MGTGPQVVLIAYFQTGAAHHPGFLFGTGGAETPQQVNEPAILPVTPRNLDYQDPVYCSQFLSCFFIINRKLQQNQ